MLAEMSGRNQVCFQYLHKNSKQNQLAFEFIRNRNRLHWKWISHGLFSNSRHLCFLNNSRNSYKTSKLLQRTDPVLGSTFIPNIKFTTSYLKNNQDWNIFNKKIMKNSTIARTILKELYSQTVGEQWQKVILWTISCNCTVLRCCMLCSVLQIVIGTCVKAAMSNPNDLLGQKSCHYINQDRTFYDILMKAAYWMT